MTEPQHPRKILFDHAELGAPLRRPEVRQASAPLRPADAPWPRLLGLDGAAAYLSLSEDVVLELAEAGTLHRVRVPAPVTARRTGGEVRKILFDRAELDALIDAWRERP